MGVLSLLTKKDETSCFGVFRSLGWAKQKGGGKVIEGKDVDNQAQEIMKLQDEDTRVRCKQRGQSTFKAKIWEWREQSTLRQRNRFDRLPQPRAEFLFRWCSCLKTESSERSWEWIGAHVWVLDAAFLKENDRVISFLEEQVLKPAYRGYCQRNDYNHAQQTWRCK